MNSKIGTLIGFAIKSNMICKGSDSITKEISHNRIAVVLALQNVSENTLGKLKRLLREQNIPLVNIADDEILVKYGLKRCRLLGIKRGPVAEGMLQTLKRENEWLFQ